MDNIYERFCDLAKQNNVKAADVSRATGISSTVFSEWKKGKARPKIDKLQKIADYFNVTLDYLMTGKIPSIKDSETSPEEEQQAIYLYKLYSTADPKIQQAVDALLKPSQ